MSYETMKTAAAVLAASVSMTGTAQASESLPTNQDAVCANAYGKGDPIVSTHEVGYRAPTDTALDQAGDDYYETYRECYGPVVSDDQCTYLGGTAMRKTTASFTEGTTAIDYTCVEDETAVDLPTDEVPSTDPTDDIPKGGYYGPPNGFPDYAGDPYPESEHPDYVDDLYLNDDTAPMGEEGNNHVPPSAATIAKCVRQALAHPRSQARLIKGSRDEMLVQHTPSTVSERCEDIVENEVIARPLLGTSKGILRPNGKSVDLDNDPDRVLQTTRKYSCLGETSDNKVRRFGVRITKVATVISSDGKETTKKRTFNTLAPKYLVSRKGKVSRNGC